MVGKTPERAIGAEVRPGFVHGLLLLMGIWLNGIASGAISPVLPQIARQFPDTPSLDLWVGLVGTMPALAVAILAIPIGALADKIGQRPILLAGLLVYGLAGLAPLALNSLHIIVFDRLVVGIGEAAVMTASTGMLGLYFTGASRDRWLSAQVATANIMGVVFVFVGGMLGTFGWRFPFSVYVLALLLFVPTFFVIREPRRVTENEAANRTPLGRAALLKLVRNLCVIILLAAAIFVVIVQMSFMLDERGAASSGEIGIGIGLSATGIALGATLAGLLTRFSARNRLALALAIAAAGFAAMAQVNGLTATVAFGFLGGFGCGVGIATLLGATVSAAPAHLLGRVAGAWSSAVFLGQFANAPLFVLGQRVFGSLPNAITAFAVVCAATAFLALLLRPRAWSPEPA